MLSLVVPSIFMHNKYMYGMCVCVCVFVQLCLCVCVDVCAAVFVLFFVVFLCVYT